MLETEEIIIFHRLMISGMMEKMELGMGEERSMFVSVKAKEVFLRFSPQAFFSLSFLEKLDLSWNQLTALPVDFSSSLPALKELRLEHNNLQHISGNRYLSVHHSTAEAYLSLLQLLRGTVTFFTVSLNVHSQTRWYIQSKMAACATAAPSVETALEFDLFASMLLLVPLQRYAA